MGILNIFKKKEEPIKEPKPGEVGFAYSGLYNFNKDFQRYNPDSLLNRKGTGVYDRMLTDDQVKAVLEFKQHAVVSRKYYFDIGQDEYGDQDNKHIEMAGFFEHCLKTIRGSFLDNMIEILSAMKYGFSICEKVFEPIEYDNKTYWGLVDIKLRPFDTFLQGIKPDKHGNIVQITQKDADYKDVEIPLEKIIHFCHHPESDRHYGESDLRSCYRAWWSKDIAIKFWNIHLERHASGFVWAQVEGQLMGEQKTDLEAVLNNISAKTGIHVPSTITLNSIQPLNTDAYEKAIASYDKAIAKSLLVPNLLGITEQGQTGSYSQSQTQLEAFFWVLDTIATRLSETLNEQIFKDLALWNFGTDDYPRFTFEEISDEKKLDLVSTWNELVKGGSVTKSESDEAWIRRNLGAPEKTEGAEDDILPVDIPDNKDWIDAQPNGEYIKREFSEKPWLRRVNFSKLERTFNRADEKLSSNLANIMAECRFKIENQIKKIAGDRSFGNVKPKEIESFTMPAGITTRIRKTLRNALQETLNETYDAASRELPARKFRRIGPGMDKTQAERFLSSRAMRGADMIEQDIVKQILQILENAIKYDKTLKQTIDALSALDERYNFLPDYETITRDGKEVIRAINKPARLETIARTNIAEAVNQARSALFGDDSLRGFVQAYEYSAILDSRVTDICEHLNGKILRDFGNYTPPNHYNCRSVLVPVTVIDDWNGKESARPSLQPQKGFG